MNAIPPPQTSPSLLLLLLLLLLPSSTNAAPLHHSQYLVAAVGAAFNPPFFVGWRQRRVIGAGTSMTSSSCRKIQMATNAPPRVTLSTSMTSPIATTTRFKQDGIRRHPIFLHTNAVSKSMPVPHPHIWRRSLKSQQQQQPCSSPSSRQRHKHSPSLRPLFRSGHRRTLRPRRDPRSLGTPKTDVPQKPRPHRQRRFLAVEKTNRHRLPPQSGRHRHAAGQHGRS